MVKACDHSGLNIFKKWLNFEKNQITEDILAETLWK